jgi:hydrogenase expression/formation protein HypC
MCVAMPGRIVEITDPVSRLARVDVMGLTRQVRLVMPEAVEPGDWVLVEIGLGVMKIDEDEARQTLRLLEEMRQAFEGAASGER